MRLLIIEDEPRFGSALKKSLESEAYAVDWEADGNSGYEKVSQEDYDLLIVDLNLPGLGGLEIIRKLRHEGDNTPVIVLTALGQTSDKINGLDSGADDYVVKPIDVYELLARIRSVLRRPHRTEATVYQLDDLRLSTATRETWRGGVLIKLTLKEYALLEYLMRSADRVVSRQELIDHVWSGDIDPFSNTVDVYIGYIRTKIDKHFPGHKPLLQTVHGIGYRLCGA